MRSFLLISTALLAACAGTIVRPVTDDNRANGIRYYEAAPFLLVYADGHGGVSSQLIYLPDVTSIRAVDPFAVLAKNETTLTFTRGVLTQSNATIDETVVPNAAITALETAASAALKAANAPDVAGREVDLPLPRLYRIVIAADGSVSLRGGHAVNADGAPIETLRGTISQSGSAPAPKADADGNATTAAGAGNSQ